MTLIKPILIAACLSMALSTGAYAQNLPKTTKEGLELVSTEGSAAVYLRPDTDFSQFRNVSLLPAYVAFREGWMKDYNRGVMRSRRLTESDLEKIKERLVAGFSEAFTEVFTEAGYGVIGRSGENLLILRPAILEVSMDSPKDQSDSSPANVVDFGTGTQMSLVLELFDASDSALVARIFNRQSETAGSSATFDSTQLNRSNELRIFRNWARHVVSQLGE